MNTDVEVVGSKLVLSPDTSIEHDTAMEFQRTATELIVKHPDTGVVIDLNKVDFVSSAGLRVFLILAKSLQKEKRDFSICNLNEVVNEIFDTSGFNQIITVHPSRDEATS